MKDVPLQYKTLVDENIYIIMDAAQVIMSLVDELGAEIFECFNEDIKITIEKLASSS